MSIGGTPAILSARLMPAGGDGGEIGADRIAALHAELIEPVVTKHGGELAGTAGDSLVAEFPDGTAAMETALDLRDGSDGLSIGIGIDSPDEPGSFTLAVRLEELAGAGEVIVSAPVHAASAELDLAFDDLGVHPLVDGDPVGVYRVGGNGRRRGAAASVGAAVSLAGLGLARLSGRRSHQRAPEPDSEDGTQAASCDVCGVLHLELPAAAADSAASIDLDAEPEFVIVGGDDEQRTLAEYARDRFEEYGLALPDVVIRFHTVEDRDEACGGHVAVARHGEDEAQIDMCGTTASTLVHELTHVWAKGGLSEDMRAEFLELRGLEEWAGTDVRWGLRGSEHAANVIAWGMQPEDPVRPTGTLPNDDDSLAAAFRLLTGGQEPMSIRTALEQGEIELYAEAPGVEPADEAPADEAAGLDVAALGAPETDEEWDDPFEVSDDPVFEEPTEPDAAEPDDDELPPELGFG